VLLAAIAILLLWTSQAAWGRSVVDGIRFKFDLTGVARITGVDSTTEVRDHCNWYEPAKARRHCAAAPAQAGAYRLLQLAPIAAVFSGLSLLGIVWTIGRRDALNRIVPLPLLGLAGALSMVAAIELLTRNVGRAVAVYSDRPLEIHGSGHTSAWLVVILFATITALTTPRRRLA
jgi:hypothetical protein